MKLDLNSGVVTHLEDRKTHRLCADQVFLRASDGAILIQTDDGRLREATEIENQMARMIWFVHQARRA